MSRWQIHHLKGDRLSAVSTSQHANKSASRPCVESARLLQYRLWNRGGVDTGALSADTVSGIDIPPVPAWNSSFTTAFPLNIMTDSLRRRIS